jgi:hypothetical protein
MLHIKKNKTEYGKHPEIIYVSDIIDGFVCFRIYASWVRSAKYICQLIGYKSIYYDAKFELYS